MRLRARILASTWVEQVALPPSGFEPPTFPAALQEQIQQTLFSISRNQTRAKFGKHGMVKAKIGQFQAERVLPSQPIALRLQQPADPSSLP